MVDVNTSYYAKLDPSILVEPRFHSNVKTNHTGAHKINNALGQVLLAKRMGKKEISLKLVPVSTV